jgi:hypothetical protein
MQHLAAHIFIFSFRDVSKQASIPLGRHRPH